MSGKFSWDPGDVVVSQCAVCRRLAPGPAAVCSAFPGAIPAEILSNDVDHRKPYLDPSTGQPGDMGVPLTGSITFLPRADVDTRVLATLYRHLDRLPRPR
jgi:hypothetical protein